MELVELGDGFDMPDEVLGEVVDAPLFAALEPVVLLVLLVDALLPELLSFELPDCASATPALNMDAVARARASLRVEGVMGCS